MSKIGRSTSKWKKDIVESEYMAKVLQNDVVEELARMHSIKSIKCLIPDLSEKILSLKKSKYPIRIVVFLDYISRGVIDHLMSFIFESRYRSTNYSRIYLAIHLSKLEMYTSIKCEYDVRCRDDTAGGGTPYI